MRLKATIQRNLLFFKLAQAVEKVGKSLYIKFSKDYVAFGANHGIGDDPNEGGSGLQCWSRLPAGALFYGYQIHSNSNDEINIELKAEDLLLAMKSATNSSSVTMRMTGRTADPYLTFVVTTEDHLGNARPITLDIPILKILTTSGAEDTHAFDEPGIDDPDVYIMPPQLDRLRNMLTSYKGLCDYVVISANLQGDMVFTTSNGDVLDDRDVPSLTPPQTRASTSGSRRGSANEPSATEQIMRRYGEAEKAQVETRFSNLFNPPLAEPPQRNANGTYNSRRDELKADRTINRPGKFDSVMIRVSDLQRVLQSQNVRPQNVICSLLDNQSILFMVYMRDTDNATLVYFIPQAGCI
ncbi:checkpoint protein Hus1/Mec3 [Linnemannia elongata]|nr:checkpoint protein Hus1/Mec3 [Linnemannia elongata]